MKKLFTTLTASALLMGSLATAASAAEVTPAPTEPAPGTTTATETTPDAVSGSVTSTVSDSNFIGNNRGFSIPRPTGWDGSVNTQEYTAAQLQTMGENGVYLVNFTYTPETADANGMKTPVTFASIRGYDKAAWDAMPNKDQMGTQLNDNGDVIYVLKPVTEAQFSNAADLERFNALAQGLTNTTSGFTTTVPAAPSTTTIQGGIPVTSDPSKISTNPTPNIELTSMTPFYKSPGGTMIGYLGPQKLDTTGNGQTDPASGQWVEIYTWMGLAWIVVE